MDLIKVKKGVGMVMDKEPIPSFEEWMRKIDALLLYCRGIRLYDLPDCPYRDWYDDRLRPIRAANKALKYALVD